VRAREGGVPPSAPILWRSHLPFPDARAQAPPASPPPAPPQQNRAPRNRTGLVMSRKASVMLRKLSKARKTLETISAQDDEVVDGLLA